MATREAYSRRGSAGPCLGSADESSSARLSRATRAERRDVLLGQAVQEIHGLEQGYVARRSRAPYLRRWALIIALA